MGGRSLKLTGVRSRTFCLGRSRLGGRDLALELRLFLGGERTLATEFGEAVV